MRHLHEKRSTERPREPDAYPLARQKSLAELADELEGHLAAMDALRFPERLGFFEKASV